MRHVPHNLCMYRTACAKRGVGSDVKSCGAPRAQWTGEIAGGSRSMSTPYSNSTPSRTPSQMQEQAMDLEAFCLLNDEDEEELAEVGVGEKDLVAFKGLLRVIKISRNIA